MKEVPLYETSRMQCHDKMVAQEDNLVMVIRVTAVSTVRDKFLSKLYSDFVRMDSCSFHSC